MEDRCAAAAVHNSIQASHFSEKFNTSLIASAEEKAWSSAGFHTFPHLATNSGKWGRNFLFEKVSKNWVKTEAFKTAADSPILRLFKLTSAIYKNSAYRFTRRNDVQRHVAIRSQLEVKVKTGESSLRSLSSGLFFQLKKKMNVL